MGIEYGTNAIRIKKLFKTQEISYNDINSVVLSDGEYTIGTKSGETIKYKNGMFDNHRPLYESFKQYNIHYRNEDEIKKTDNVYSIEKVYAKVDELKPFITEYLNEQLEIRLGAGHSIDIKIVDNCEYMDMYFVLMKDGEIVKDIFTSAIQSGFVDDIVPYSFYDFVLSFLIEWEGNGRYGLTEQAKNRDELVKYLDESIDYIFEECNYGR